jgi:membrane protease YdiL (CAAX protease family)
LRGDRAQRIAWRLTLGLMFAVVYVWRQSLVAPIVMHFLQDFPGIVALPLMGLR